MKIQDLNTAKLLTTLNNKIKVFKEPLQDNGTKYIVYKDNGTRLHYNSNKELIDYQLFFNNFSISKCGLLIYMAKDKTLKSCNLIAPNWYDDKTIPTTIINKAKKVLNNTIKFI